jgi:hypothetical protein
MPSQPVPKFLTTFEKFDGWLGVFGKTEAECVSNCVSMLEMSQHHEDEIAKIFYCLSEKALESFFNKLEKNNTKAELKIHVVMLFKDVENPLNEVILNANGLKFMEYCRDNGYELGNKGNDLVLSCSSIADELVWGTASNKVGRRSYFNYFKDTIVNKNYEQKIMRLCRLIVRQGVNPFYSVELNKLARSKNVNELVLNTLIRKMKGKK